MQNFITRKYTGSFALLDSLVRNGVTSIFGYPGGAILPIYDELYFWESYNLIKHFLVRHEQGAAHAADGWARGRRQLGPGEEEPCGRDRVAADREREAAEQDPPLRAWPRRCRATRSYLAGWR